MGRDSRPAHVRVAESRPYRFREHRFRFLLDAEETGGSYSAMHINSPGGTGPRPHVHEAAEEIFFLLSGQVTFHTEEAGFQASAGDLIHVPRGTMHHFVVDSDDATYLAFYAPGGDERGLREAAVPEEDAGDIN